MFCVYCNKQYTSSSHLDTKKHNKNLIKYNREKVTIIQEEIKEDVQLPNDILGIILDYKIEMEKPEEIHSIIDEVLRHDYDHARYVTFRNKYVLTSYYTDNYIVDFFKNITNFIVCENDPCGKYVRTIDVSYNFHSKSIYLIF